MGVVAGIVIVVAFIAVFTSMSRATSWSRRNRSGDQPLIDPRTGQPAWPQDRTTHHHGGSSGGHHDGHHGGFSGGGHGGGFFGGGHDGGGFSGGGGGGHHG